MISLVDFLRKRLKLGSQYPSVEKEAEWYVKEIDDHMMRFGFDPMQRTVVTSFLRGEAT